MTNQTFRRRGGDHTHYAFPGARKKQCNNEGTSQEEGGLGGRKDTNKTTGKEEIIVPTLKRNS